MLSGAGLLAIGAAWAPSVEGPILCPLRALTGIPCPTCGLTRSVCATLHGQWEAALDLHPLGPVVVVLAAALALLGLGELAGLWRILPRLRRLASPVFFAALALEVVLIWPPNLRAAFAGGVRPVLARGLVTRAFLVAPPVAIEPAGPADAQSLERRQRAVGGTAADPFRALPGARLPRSLPAPLRAADLHDSDAAAGCAL